MDWFDEKFDECSEQKKQLEKLMKDQSDGSMKLQCMILMALIEIKEEITDINRRIYEHDGF